MKAMKKWGIRAIAMYFLFGAISTLIELIIGLTKGIPLLKGFMGIKWVITHGGEPIMDLMAWIGVCISGYIAYHLFMLHTEGRIGALIILWLSVISAGFGFIFSLIWLGKFSTWNTSYMTFHILNRSIRLESPINLLLLIIIFFLFYAIQIYFLMRKDVKAEFQGQEDAQLNHHESEEQTVQ